MVSGSAWRSSFVAAHRNSAALFIFFNAGASRLHWKNDKRGWNWWAAYNPRNTSLPPSAGQGGCRWVLLNRADAILGVCVDKLWSFWKIEPQCPPELGNHPGVLKKIKLRYIFGLSEVCETLFFENVQRFSRGCSRFFRRELTSKVPKSPKKCQKIHLCVFLLIVQRKKWKGVPPLTRPQISLAFFEVCWASFFVGKGVDLEKTPNIWKKNGGRVFF